MADDKLSTMVCLQCVEKVNNWQSFKLTCCENQTKLEQWMNISSADLSDMVKYKFLYLDFSCYCRNFT